MKTYLRIVSLFVFIALVTVGCNDKDEPNDINDLNGIWSRKNPETEFPEGTNRFPFYVFEVVNETDILFGIGEDGVIEVGDILGTYSYTDNHIIITATHEDDENMISRDFDIEFKDNSSWIGTMNDKFVAKEGDGHWEIGNKNAAFFRYDDLESLFIE